LNILQLSSAKTFGGGEQNLVDLTIGLQRRGHQVRFAGRPGSALLQRLTHLPPDHISLIPLRNAIDVHSASLLSRLVKQQNIEIIHAHMARDYSLAAYAVSRNPRTRLVITRHVLFALHRLQGRVLAHASRVIAVSGAVARQLEKQKLLPAEKIVVIENGIDFSRLRDRAIDRKEFCRGQSFPDDALIIGTVGELNPLKGHDLFVRAAARVAEKSPRARFVIVGDDHSQKKETELVVQKLIKKLRLEDRVRLLGEVEEVGPLLAVMDLFVSASRTESFGLAIVEAMASGVAVIATATEGAQELIREGETGLLVPLDDEAAMAEKILGVLENPHKRTRMAQQARTEAVDRFDVERMIDAVEQLYSVTACRS
jgi:L-malate glycosyltransferase